MTQVQIVGGKLVVKKEPTAKGNNKPAKYPYPQPQYDELLKLAKSSGIDIGSTPASKTKACNAVTRALIEDFIAQQNKPKTE